MSSIIDRYMLSRSLALPCRSMRVICSFRRSGHSLAGVVDSLHQFLVFPPGGYVPRRPVADYPVHGFLALGQRPVALDFSCPVVERQRWRDYLVGVADRVLIVLFVGPNSGAFDAPPLAGFIP